MKYLVTLLIAIAVFCVAAHGQAITTVTATLRDSSLQVWSQATWSTKFIPPFGNPSPPNNQGHPITPNQSGVADTSGFFTVNLDDNNVVAPAGSKWEFTICPNASVTTCTVLQLVITGGSMNVGPAINPLLTVPVVGTTPSISRAYNDSEANGSLGALYINTIDNSLRQCQSIECQGSGWVVITVPTNNPVFTGTLTVPCVKFDPGPLSDTTVCAQNGTGHINVTLPVVSGTLAELDSPAFTGVPTAPTPLSIDNSTTLATTAYVKNQGYVTASTAPVTSVFSRTGAVTAQSGDYTVGQVTGAAPILSPTFLGTPAAPTAAPGTSTTQLATTAFVQAAVGSSTAILAQSTTTCSGCPITYGNTDTTIISHSVTMPSSGCPCRVYAYYTLYLTTGSSGADLARVTDGTNNWAGGNNNTTGSVGGGSTYGLQGSGISPVTYANSSTTTFTVKSANSHAGNVTANLNPASDVTAGTWPQSSLQLTVISSQ